MHKKFLLIGSLLAALAVVLGAFAAHGLKQIAEAETIQTFQTGVQYQMVHALALMITGILAERISSKFLIYAGWFFITGIILFSGSLYLLTLFKTTDMPGLYKPGLVTPIGGISFILGWLFLFLSLWRKK